jgi:hypothetical protein
MQNNLHAFSNLQQLSNSHASATPEIHMPMNNMTSSVSLYETPNVRNFSSMQDSVSSSYSSVNSSQYMVSALNMPMDREIVHATASYLANYSQPSYATSFVTNYSAPYATSGIHNSAPHLYNGYSRINGNSIGTYVPSSSTVAYGTSPTQLQDFGSIQVSLPKESENAEGQVYPSWDECKEKFINPLKKISPKPTEKNTDNIITFDDLSDEQRQGYEVLRKKRREEFEAMKKKLMKKYEEEDLQEFLASLKKDHQDNVIPSAYV